MLLDGLICILAKKLYRKKEVIYIYIFNFENLVQTTY